MADTSPQERQDERAAVMLTRGEKEDLRLVAMIERTSESEVLRSRTVEQIVARAAAIREAMPVGASR